MNARRSRRHAAAPPNLLGRRPAWWRARRRPLVRWVAAALLAFGAAVMTGQARPGRTAAESADPAGSVRGGATGLAALVPAGWRAVAVPRPADGSGLAVTVGDVVDVLAPDTGPGDGGPAAVAARDATVIAVADAAVTVAVPVADAAPLAAALGRGVPVLALVGPVRSR